MSTVPEKVAQRLEELSLELDNNELLTLAEELSQWNPLPPVISETQLPRERQAQRMLEQIAMMLHREGYRARDPRTEEEYRLYQRYADQIQPPRPIFFNPI